MSHPVKKRRHDGDHTTDMNATNAVLRDILGGRQRSWMQSAQGSRPPPKRKRPQLAEPQHVPQQQQRQPQQEQEQEEEQAQTQEQEQQNHQQAPEQRARPLSTDASHGSPVTIASSASSPQLANVISHEGSRSPLPLSPARLPSPPPIEDTSEATPSAAGGAVPSRMPTQDAREAEGNRATHSGLCAERVGMHFEGAGLMEELHQAASAPGCYGHAGAPIDVDAQTDGQSGRRAALPQRSPISASLSNAWDRPPPQQPAAMLAPATTLPQSHAGFARPHIPAQSMLASRSPNAAHPTAAPLVRSPTEFTGARGFQYMTPERSLALIKDFCLRRGNMSGRELARVGVVHEALLQYDWHYLHIHQIYCTMDIDVTKLPLRLQQDRSLVSARRLLQDVLDSNDVLSPDVRLFFARFPMPIEDIGSPQILDVMVQVFLRFATSSVNFPQVRQMCVNRRCPPLVTEIRFNLGITSPVLQKIVFTAILRNIASVYSLITQGRADPFEQQALELFAQNQADFAVRSRNGFPAVGSPEFQSESHRETNRFGLQLQQLCERQEQLARSLRLATAPHPQAPSAPTPQQLPQHTMVTHVPILPSVPANRRAISQRVPSRGRAPIVPRPLSTPVNTSLLSPPGTQLPIQREANPARFALHEVALRSPTLRPQSLNITMYQYVCGFAKPPARVNEPNPPIDSWPFFVELDDWRRKPMDTDVSEDGAAPQHLVNEYTRMWRLRCVKWTSNDLPDDHAWAVTATAWHPLTYFTFNGKPLHHRKKLHWGKDMPTDLTGLLQQGENTLDITVVHHQADKTYRDYLLAIETLAFKEHGQIKESCIANSHISEATVLEAIRKKLTTDNSEDEIAIVESTLTIRLIDPISMSGFPTIPVRSKACVHHDCFDLDTFLESRNPKETPISEADVWKCPICNADARPHILIVDGFLENVHKNLISRGLGHTRAIIVNQDGTWQPKSEPISGSSGREKSASWEDEPLSINPPKDVRSNTPPADGREIIEID